LEKVDMFRNPSAAEPLPLKVVEVATGLVPLSVLSLDLVAPELGWVAYLNSRGIEVVTDDLGRLSISRADARQLFDEHRENEARKARHLEAAEAAAIEADRVRFAQIWRGVPADAIPDGVRAGDAMVQAAIDSQPQRQSPVREALGGKSMVYHAFPAHPDEE
jgi:hypothetical protein